MTRANDTRPGSNRYVVERPDGTHVLDRHRNVYAIRTYARSPADVCRRSGFSTISQGAKSAAIRIESGSTRVTSTTTSTCAWTVSPNRATLGARSASASTSDARRVGARRARLLARDPGGHDDERRTHYDDPGQDSPDQQSAAWRHARHVPNTRLVRLRSVQTRNSVRIANGLARRYEDRVDVERAEPREERLQPRCVVRTALGGLFPPQADGRQPARPRVAQRDDDPARRRESSAPRSDPG